MIALLGLASLSYSIGPFSASWIAEAEKKHARAAMVAFPTLVALSAVTDHPVDWLNHQPAGVQIGAYAAAATLEALNLARLKPGFALKDGEEPGRVRPVSATAEQSDAEDAVGRLAMLSATAFLAAAAAS